MNKLPQDHNIATRLVNVVDYERQRSLVNAIIEATPEGILVVDEHGIIVSHNQQFVEIWRIPAYKLKGHNGDTAIGADDNPILAHNAGCVKDKQAFLARIRELYDNPQLDDHCEIELKDGRMLERHSTVLRNSEGQYLGRVWFFRDITSQKQTEAKLKDLATRDPLTGVANRRYFFERANHEFARRKRLSQPLSIAELDVDSFKQINDRYGHAVGDEVLKSLCVVSQRLLREIDVFARIGGEEFAVLLPDTDLAGAVFLANRLQRTIAEGKLALKSDEFNYTISIGVATLRPADTCIDDCLLRADSAMYKAKQNGRNRVEVES
jgi:diguanylate cyclase (GGDEF)-like protein/PAS domain S-box-containing protein